MRLPIVSNLRIRDRLLPIALSQIVGLACGLTSVHVTTRWIAPADYGRYGIFLSLVPVGMWVFHAGLVKWVARHWAQVTEPRAALGPLFASASRTLWLFVPTAFGLGAFLDRETWWLTGTLLVVAASLMSVGSVFQTALQATRRHWTDFGVSSVASVSRSFVPPLLYLCFPGLSALKAGFAVYSLVFASAGWIVLSRARPAANTPNPPFNPVYGGTLFFALAIAHGTLSGVNRWISGTWFSPDYTGLFTLAGNVAIVPTTMLGTIVLQQFQPDVFAMKSDTHEGKRALAARVDAIAFGFTLAAFAGLLALQWALPRLFTGFIHDTYAGAIPLITACGAFLVAINVGQYYQMMLLAGHREKACGWVDLPGAALLIGGGVLAAVLGGARAFQLWLTFSPVVPWVWNRTTARRHLFAAHAVS